MFSHSVDETTADNLCRVSSFGDESPMGMASRLCLPTPMASEVRSRGKDEGRGELGGPLSRVVFRSLLLEPSRLRRNRSKSIGHD